MEKSLAERLKEYLESPEGIKAADDYFDKLEKEQNLLNSRLQKIHEQFGSIEKFDEIVTRILEKQRKSDDKHWATYTDAPLCITNLIWEYGMSYGNEIEPINDFTESFPSHVTEHLGYQFSITHGQGSVMTIYKNKEILYSS